MPPSPRTRTGPVGATRWPGRTGCSMPCGPRTPRPARSSRRTRRPRPSTTPRPRTWRSGWPGSARPWTAQLRPWSRRPVGRTTDGGSMSDFYYARYEHLSHRELYDMVRAGDPNTLDQVATRWFTMGNTAGSLSSDLQRDLAALGHTWQGSAGAEFQRRLLSVAQFSDTLAAEFDGLHSNAKYLASRLREAQSKAEDPAATDDNDKMASGAMNGAAIGSVAGPAGPLFGGIVGAIDGHSQDEAEKEKAHKRMIALVADLAADYAYAGTTMSSDQLAAAPPDLPAGTSG